MKIGKAFKVMELDLLTCLMNAADSKVPFLIGDCGVGKSTIVENLSKSKVLKFNTGKKVKFLRIYGSLLKEGEITGIPFNTKNKEGKMVLKYSVHHVIEQARKNHEAGFITILFIDELNRADHQVHQELMAVSLSRTIHGKKLPITCLIVAAGNPEDTEDENMDYQVNRMNPALRSRFNFIELESDAESWIRWGMEKSKKMIDGEKKSVVNIEEAVIEFIADHPEMLSKHSNSESSFPDPRGWHKVSDTFRTFKNSKGFTNADFVAACMGTVGNEAISMFNSFLIDRKNPMIKVYEILTKNIKARDTLEVDIKNRLENENPHRVVILFNRLVKELKKIKKSRKSYYRLCLMRFVQALTVIPKDTMKGVFSELFLDKGNKILNGDLTEIPAYAAEYLKVKDMINTIKELD